MLGGIKRVGIKVGSSLLTNDEGVNREYILNLCRQIAEVKRSGHQVFLVTSGAVASEPCRDFSDNLRAAIGQACLVGDYREFFGIFNLKVAQILVNDTDIATEGFSVVGWTIGQALFRPVIPIINANDVTSSKELKALSVCADNDRLSQAICGLLGSVDLMIIAMDEDGLVGREEEIIREIYPSRQLGPLIRLARRGSKKGFGRHGMKTKITVAYELAQKGVKVILAPGRADDFILRACRGEKNFGTAFLPRQPK